MLLYYLKHMSLKFSKFENKIIKDFNKDGFIIFDIKEKKSLFKIKKFFEKKINQISRNKKTKILKNKDILNNFHKNINSDQLNDFRIELYNSINNQKWFLDEYFGMGKRHLEVICGNELAMQRKVNLSIQLPKDDSSLLPLHSDVWSGCSAYEVVLWIPLVDCYEGPITSIGRRRLHDGDVQDVFILTPNEVSTMPQTSSVIQCIFEVLSNEHHIVFLTDEEDQIQDVVTIGMLSSPIIQEYLTLLVSKLSSENWDFVLI